MGMAELPPAEWGAARFRELDQEEHRRSG